MHKVETDKEKLKKVLTGNRERITKMTTEEMLAEAIRLLKKYVPPGFSEVIDFLKHTERIEQDQKNCNR